YLFSRPRRPPPSPPFPYTTLFRSVCFQSTPGPGPSEPLLLARDQRQPSTTRGRSQHPLGSTRKGDLTYDSHHEQQRLTGRGFARSEEHTSELQSRENLVCRLLLDK